MEYGDIKQSIPIFGNSSNSLSALIIDSHIASRTLMTLHLKEFGVNSIKQCTNLSDARKIFNDMRFDIVLCEQNFSNENSSGQHLLYDLRKSQLLPFSTIFIMVTGDATYETVTEAAESALDSYLLKPHKASQLLERLKKASRQKLELKEIHKTIEDKKYEKAVELCINRFNAKKEYWLYAARISSELLLRLGRNDEAMEMYKKIIKLNALPWAKLGIAKSMIQSGKTNNAIQILNQLICEEPMYADAYDVMGRAQLETSNIESALSTYKLACKLTPTSVHRLQSYGLMLFYFGDSEEAEKTLAKASQIGVGSSMFDSQSLVLLAFVRCVSGNEHGVKQCKADIEKILKNKSNNDNRYQRQHEVISTIFQILKGDFVRCIDSIRHMSKDIMTSSFDFEAASNLLTLLALMGNKAIKLDEFNVIVNKIGLRFCSSRYITEMLVGAASKYKPYADRIKSNHNDIIDISQESIMLSMNGDPLGAINKLNYQYEINGNINLIKNSSSVLQRYKDKVAMNTDIIKLEKYINDLKIRFGNID